MSRTLLRLAAVSALFVTVSSCDDSTTAPVNHVPKAAFSVTPNTPISQAITDLIQQIYPVGLRTEASARWDNIASKVEAARKKPKQQAQQAVVGRKMLANLVSWIQSHTAEVSPPEGETVEHVVARLVLYMSVYAYGDPAAPLPPVPPMGSDAVVAVVDPGSETTVISPEEQAAINLPEGAVAEATVLVIYEDAGENWARCSGPLDTTLCQYPHFYHFDIFPHERLQAPARVGVCHILSGPNAPLRDAEHDGRLRVAHEVPADQANYTPNAVQVEGVEILPLTDISDFLMCNHPETASGLRSHKSNSLADRGWRALDKLGSAAKWLFVPKTAYAIDQGLGGVTLEFSTFEVLDPHSNDPVPTDATPPSVEPVVTGTSSNGWYTSDVTVTWAVSDAESGIISPECPGSTVTSNTAGVTFTCSATSAGGTTVGSVTIKRDATAPTVSSNVVGTLGNGDWYTSNVGVTWSVAEDVSEIVSSSGCGDASLTSDTDGITYTCEATNAAGLSNSKNVTLKRDATPPVIVPTISGTLSATGWYTDNANVSWGVTDATSGVGSSTGCGDAVVSEDTPGKSIGCSASDKAGNASERTVMVKRDASPPIISPTISGTLGNAGWYTSDVSVSWSVSDPTSGILTSTGCGAALIISDTQTQSFTCSATNGATLDASTSASVKRDATKPVIAYGGNAGTYTVDQTVAITCSASDATSGLASNSCQNVGGDAYTFGLGAHEYSASASDVAGNSNSASTSFSVQVTPPSLCALTRRFSSKPDIASALCAKLSAYQASVARGSSTSAAGELGAYIKQVEAQTGKAIPAAKASVLIALARAL